MKAFTPDQVFELQVRQLDGTMHPYTCPNRSDNDHRDTDGVLVPTVRGWICPYCDYTQDWSHETRRFLTPKERKLMSEALMRSVKIVPEDNDTVDLSGFFSGLPDDKRKSALSHTGPDHFEGAQTVHLITAEFQSSFDAQIAYGAIKWILSEMGGIGMLSLRSEQKPIPQGDPLKK